MSEKKRIIAGKLEDAKKFRVTATNRITPEGDWVSTYITDTVRDCGGTVTDWGSQIHEIKPGSIPPDKHLHYHKEQDSLFVVLKGRIVWCAEGTEYEVGAGSFMWIPRGAIHEFVKVIEPVTVFVTVSNPDHATDAISSKLPWYEQYPEPRPRKVIG